MTAWLHVIGVGEKGLAELPASIRTILGYAEAVLGPSRFLGSLEPRLSGTGREQQANPELVHERGLEAVARALLNDGPEEQVAPNQFYDGRTVLEWEPPLERMIEQVLRFRGRPTVILATGDPTWYGIGATLARHLEHDEYVIHPQPSAFQLAAAQLHWPLQSVATVSLHGRPVELLQSHLLPGNRILALTTDRGTADQVLETLIDRGYGRSVVWVLEDLGGLDERITSATADSLDTQSIGDFYVLGIACVADPGAPLLPSVPGLPDQAFAAAHGMVTKREVRAATLARLSPFPGALLWDVGAGSGSIAVEWMRASREARAIAFERRAERCEMIAVNAAALGVPGLRIEAGEAPASFSGCPAPDAVFIGGDVGNDELFDACWEALKPGGRLVANAVTLEGEQALFLRQEALGGDLVRIDISVLDRVGRHRVLRSRLPVTQWAVVKATHGEVTQP